MNKMPRDSQKALHVSKDIIVALPYFPKLALNDIGVFYTNNESLREENIDYHDA